MREGVGEHVGVDCLNEDEQGEDDIAGEEEVWEDGDILWAVHVIIINKNDHNS